MVICFLSVFVGVTAAVEQEDVKGANITLACSLPGTVTFPTWKGPPESTVYLAEGQETNSSYPWVSYADNSRDLVVSDALPNYSGDYTCEKDGNAAETITLSVLGKMMSGLTQLSYNIKYIMTIKTSAHRHSRSDVDSVTTLCAGWELVMKMLLLSIHFIHAYNY